MKYIKKPLNLSILMLVTLFVVLPGRIWAQEPYDQSPKPVISVNLAGVIFDSTTGQPIDRATVILERYITKTTKWVLAETNVYVMENNPQISGFTYPIKPGYYQFNITFPSGYNSRKFRLKIDAPGYVYPSVDPLFNVTTTTIFTDVKRWIPTTRIIYVDDDTHQNFSIGGELIIKTGDPIVWADIPVDVKPDDIADRDIDIWQGKKGLNQNKGHYNRGVRDHGKGLGRNNAGQGKGQGKKGLHQKRGHYNRGVRDHGKGLGRNNAGQGKGQGKKGLHQKRGHYNRGVRDHGKGLGRNNAGQGKGQGKKGLNQNKGHYNRGVRNHGKGLGRNGAGQGKGRGKGPK